MIFKNTRLQKHPKRARRYSAGAFVSECSRKGVKSGVQRRVLEVKVGRILIGFRQCQHFGLAVEIADKSHAGGRTLVVKAVGQDHTRMPGVVRQRKTLPKGGATKTSTVCIRAAIFCIISVRMRFA